jgi:hypothetical protein
LSGGENPDPPCPTLKKEERNLAAIEVLKKLSVALATIKIEKVLLGFGCLFRCFSGRSSRSR